MRCRFKMNVFNGKELVIEGHVTNDYVFTDAIQLAHSIIRLTSHSSRGLHIVTPKGSINIDLPSMPGGYGVDTVVVLMEVIPA